MCEGILQQSSGECTRAEVKQSWRMIDARKAIKRSIEVRSQRIKEQKRGDYRLQDTQVQRGVKRDEQEWFEELAKEADSQCSKETSNQCTVPPRKYATNRPRRWMQ